MKKLFIFSVGLILVIGIFLRFYNLGNTPPSLNWDEASIGYDAWLISQTGTDQWGAHWPLIFKSFGEYKYPFHIYATALVIKLIGLSDFAVRLPSAVMGLVCLGLLYLLAKRLTNSKIIALIAVSLLSVSPWSIQFSRINWETNFALSFFLFGLLLFYKGLENKRLLFIFSFLLFGLTIFTYNAAKVFTPLFVVCLILIYRKELWQQKIISLIGIAVFGIFILANILNPQISGLVRYSQVSFTEDSIKATNLYNLTHKHLFGKAQLVVGSYLSYYSPKFLFLSGDPSLQHSTQAVGEIYWLEGLFLIIGVVYLFKNKKSKINQILLAWLIIAPLAGSLTQEAPHAGRAMFELGALQIIEAIGVYQLYGLCKTKVAKHIFAILTLSLFLINISFYSYNYFYVYPLADSVDWQYGYKAFYQKYSPILSQYNQIYFSPQYAEPYIFALYYLKVPGNEFRSTAIYNKESEWGFSTVTSFANFNFNRFSDVPLGNNLIVSEKPGQFKGYNLTDQIKFLDQSTAFYIYSQ